MTAPSPTRSLGSHMREVAKHLDAVSIMTLLDAKNCLMGMDLGYTAAVLIRLEQRGVARRVDNDYDKWVRGPAWQEASDFYMWHKLKEIPDEAQE